MTSLNKVTLIGNLGSQPEIRKSNTGSVFATFSLATHESWKDKEGNKHQETEWHRIVVFNEQIAGFIEKHVDKGDHVYLEGKLHSRAWTNEDGQTLKAMEIVLPRYNGDFKLLSKKSQSPDAGSLDDAVERDVVVA